MHITDLHGKRIEVTDLNKAIAQAEAFANYCHKDGSNASFDEELHNYWQDILKNLQALPKNQ